MSQRFSTCGLGSHPEAAWFPRCQDWSSLDTSDPERDSEPVWNGYSARQAAELVGLPESAIRGCARAGLVAPDDSAVPMRFSFRDLSVLKAVRALVAAGIPLRRVRRQLSALQRRLPAQTSLAETVLLACEGNVVVRERERVWRADSGQMVLLFTSAERRGELRAMPVRREAPGPEPVLGLSAEDWLERAVELEELDTIAAIGAYERALRLRRDFAEAWINLGRLHAESSNTEHAIQCFREALSLDPADATALYNLGVVSQDAGRDEEAMVYYQRALRIDAELAEAHYNLATIFDRRGDARAAIRHINEYRKLTRNKKS